MNNFKIRVVENIGRYSARGFGSVGIVLNVVDGTLIDSENREWTMDGEKFSSIHDVNKYFGEKDQWQTVFELVEESNYSESVHEPENNTEQPKPTLIDIIKKCNNLQSSGLNVSFQSAYGEYIVEHRDIDSCELIMGFRFRISFTDSCIVAVMSYLNKL